MARLKLFPMLFGKTVYDAYECFVRSRGFVSIDSKDCGIILERYLYDARRIISVINPLEK